MVKNIIKMRETTQETQAPKFNFSASPIAEVACTFNEESF